MMTKKKASEIRSQVAQMIKELPEGWLDQEIVTAKNDPDRDVKTLEMICDALQDEVRKRQRKKRTPQKNTAGV